MKNYLKVSLLASFFCTQAHGATIAISNATGPTTITAITYNDSTFASGGIVAAGYFMTLTDALVTTLSADLGNVTQLINDFSIVGSGALDSEAPGFGIYAGDFTASLPNASRSGANLYSFLGNANTLEDSTQWLLWRHTDVIDSVDTVTNPDSNSLILGQEGVALISGGTFATSIDFDGPGGDVPLSVGAIRLAAVAIPEPSALLLTALGALALLRRKR